MGVLLLDGASGRCHMLFRQDYGFLPPGEEDVVIGVLEDLNSWLAESPEPIQIVERLEDTCSNSILISERVAIQVEGDPKELLQKLYLKHMEP